MDIERFRKQPIMGILRGVNPSELTPVFDAAAKGGLQTIEIAMNTQDAPRVLREAQRINHERFMIGAGTVVNMGDLKKALGAGATFIVMPVLVKEVVEYCKQFKIPVFPGALDPQGIFDAWQAGATMVKVFPAKLFGPEYFREIKGPFPEIELMACSGVTPENLRPYFQHGASAVAVGSSVFRSNWIATGDFDRITNCIRDYLQQLSYVQQA